MESLTVLARKISVMQQMRYRRGFTLVELIVVLAIISIISAIAVTGQSKFNQDLLLTNTAYTVALSGREAQSFGLSSRKFGSVSNTGYGLHFDRSLPNSYLLFADVSNTPATAPFWCPLGAINTPERKPGNCVYDSSLDGIVEKFTFSRGFTIQKFCGVISGIKTCSTDIAPLTTLDVVFTRPNTASTISGSTGGSLLQFSCAEITLTDSENVTTKSIRISSLGEISIGQVCS